jgi:hypothetical protein
MKNLRQNAASWLAVSLATAMTACGGGGGTTTPPPSPTAYSLTVNTVDPTAGVGMTVSPADNNGAGNGSASFTRTYNSGTVVSITAPATAGTHTFSAWSGCTSANTVTCSVTLNANATVTATFVSPTIPITPNSAVIGSQVQFNAALPAGVTGGVTWAIAAPSGSTFSPGTISTSGLYNTPYPAPASITVTATSTSDATVVGSATVALSQPAAATGPALTLDVGTVIHTINPYIYGMNAFQLAQSEQTAANLPINRWGGDATSRYNYKLDVTSSASDWYFENHTGTTGLQDTSEFNQQVQSDLATGTKTIGTVPVNGWVAKDGTSCSFPKTTYPSQVGFDPYAGACGDGLYPNGVSGCTSATGCDITGVSSTATSTAVDATWTSGWVTYLVSKFGTAANGGVAVYDLDNEPSWWDAVHRDVHPAPFSYDEVTNNGIAHAAAIKAADPTAEVSGPVMDYWWAYFYSKKDIESGWGSGPCYEPWSNPIDRNAHSGVPFIEYYLQQFAAYEKAHGTRLLDYLDLHTYFAPGNLAFSTGGDTQTQEIRLNSTRVFWDPTYTDPNFPQPNYTTDANYTSNCSTPLQAPDVIPMMKKWVANDYPGTKLAITEYNWGGQESISGALAQADILGIFGREGLDIGTLWGAPDPTTQIPGLIAFEIFRNYDGAKSTFGDQAILSTSADQGKLSIYGALRSKDNVLTVVVINKTYGDFATALNLANFTAAGPAQSFLYSSANLNAIVAQSNITVTAPSGGSTTSTLSTTFPAQSITILVVPKA